MPKLGIITIGQSPRSDFTNDLTGLFNKSIKILEKGILDDFSYEEVLDKFSPKNNESILVSRMRDGKEVYLSEAKILSAMQDTITRIEMDVDIILLFCTGKFPIYKSSKPLIIPHQILCSLVPVLSINKKIGIVVPAKEQISPISHRWNSIGIDIEIKVASPYKPLGYIENVARSFEDDIDIIVLDCMGYSIKMKNTIKTYSKKPVILPRTLVTRVINELLA